MPKPFNNHQYLCTGPFSSFACPTSLPRSLHVYFSWTKIAPKGEDIPLSIAFEYGLAPRCEHLGPNMWRKAQGNNELVLDRMKLYSVSPSFVAVSQLRRAEEQLS